MVLSLGWTYFLCFLRLLVNQGGLLSRGLGASFGFGMLLLCFLPHFLSCRARRHGEHQARAQLQRRDGIVFVPSLCSLAGKRHEEPRAQGRLRLRRAHFLLPLPLLMYHEGGYRARGLSRALARQIFGFPSADQQGLSSRSSSLASPFSVFFSRWLLCYGCFRMIPWALYVLLVPRGERVGQGREDNGRYQRNVFASAHC